MVLLSRLRPKHAERSMGRDIGSAAALPIYAVSMPEICERVGLDAVSSRCLRVLKMTSLSPYMEQMAWPAVVWKTGSHGRRQRESRDVPITLRRVAQTAAGAPPSSDYFYRLKLRRNYYPG
jgi:hypothetical protein